MNKSKPPSNAETSTDTKITRHTGTIKPLK
jgi:hypothetical protein